MRLDMEVDLGPGDVVLDGVPDRPYKGHSPPLFGPWLDGWIHHLVRNVGPGHIVLDGEPAPPHRERGTAAPSSFRPMSIVATVAHLSYC